MDTVELFMALFSGRRDVYGSVEGKSNKEPVTAEMYRLHLEGKKSLGIYPLLDDATCNFFAVDIDVKNFDLAASIREEMGLVDIPMYICESKGKGFHVYGFGDKIIAKDIRWILLSVLAKLEVSAEVFPKQDKLDETIKYGNYINLPCFGTTRQFQTAHHEPVATSSALSLIRKVTQEIVLKAKEKFPTETPAFILKEPDKRKNKSEKHPPCIENILEGVPQGCRDEAAFALARYHLDHDYTLENTLVVLREWDQKNKPPLADEGIIQTKIESAAKGYTFGCNSIKNAPLLSSYCVGETKCFLFKKPTNDNEDKRAQSTILLALAADVETFHTPDDNAYVSFNMDENRETWALSARGFKRWLLRRFYKETGKAPNTQAYNEALGILEARAQCEGEEHQVFTRLAEQNGAIYLDLANQKWEAIEITANGWSLIQDVPVKFRRSKGMLPLPYPSPEGNLELLHKFINISSRDDWAQVKGWLVQTCRPRGPYPVLVLNGEAGSAKTTLSRVLRELVDPNSAPTRVEPRNTQDLMIACNNSWILCLDNLSSLHTWLSDAICRLATGGGFSTRELYTDQDEIIFNAMRPVILNSIESIIARGDLADRTIILNLPSMADNCRRPEKEFWAEFKAARPIILTGLLNAVATAIQNEPNVKLARLPRMADFAVWATAAEPALNLQPGEFLKAYSTNQVSINESVLEGSPVAMAILALLKNKDYHEATPTEFLKDLTGLVDEDTRKQRSWPKNPKALHNALTRLAPNLRSTGIVIEKGRTPGSDGRRFISIRKVGAVSAASVAPVAPDTNIVTTHPSLWQADPSQPAIDLSHTEKQSDGYNGCDRSKPILSKTDGPPEPVYEEPF